MDAALEALETALDQLLDSKKEDTSPQQPDNEKPDDNAQTGNNTQTGNNEPERSVQTGDTAASPVMAVILLSAAVAAGISGAKLSKKKR